MNATLNWAFQTRRISLNMPNPVATIWFKYLEQNWPQSTTFLRLLHRVCCSELWPLLRNVGWQTLLRLWLAYCSQFHSRDVNRLPVSLVWLPFVGLRCTPFVAPLWMNELFYTKTRFFSISFFSDDDKEKTGCCLCWYVSEQMFNVLISSVARNQNAFSLFCFIFGFCLTLG